MSKYDRIKENPKTKKGFTLTEILVVVIIISVLAAIVYPLYTKAIVKSRAVEAINLLEMVRNKQLQKYARDMEYYNDFNNIGRITSNPSLEKSLSGGAQLKIKDYTLSLNNSTNCMSAQYSKGSTTFTFSSSYDTAGLGCTGSICTSFGDIIGAAESVCNCGKKECSGGFDMNPSTCNCDCNKECNDGVSCRDMTGGGTTRPCVSGCGIESSSPSCNESIWTGKCWSPAKALESQPCGMGGRQTRTCKAVCSGEDCSAWGQCRGQKCDTALKPKDTQSCGKCGTQTRLIMCDTTAGMWSAGVFGTCKGEGACKAGTTQKCGNNGTKICSDDCSWGSCTGQECDPALKPEDTLPCGRCGTQTRTILCNSNTGMWSYGIFGFCQDQGVCSPGEEQSCSNDTGTQQCLESCAWGKCEKKCTLDAAACAGMGRVFDKGTCACLPCRIGLTSVDGISCKCNRQCSGNFKLDMASCSCKCDKQCSSGYLLDNNTCTCKCSKTDSECPSGKKVNACCKCECSGTCPYSGQALSLLDCRCKNTCNSPCTLSGNYESGWLCRCGGTDAAGKPLENVYASAPNTEFVSSCRGGSLDTASY